MLKISTFNIQNDFTSYNKTKSNIIINYLKKYKINILGLQEVNYKTSSDLEKYLHNSKYNITGKYRFFLKHRFNEKVPIITNLEELSTKTYYLPTFPSPLKRIVTKTVVKINNTNISIYNTHLDYLLESVKEKELKKLYQLLKKEENPIILMGDFNLKTNKEIFTKFIKQLESLNIYRVKIGEKTWKMSKYKREIDHIFLSIGFKLKKVEVIKDLEISDHYPVLVSVKIDNKIKKEY